MGTVTQMPGTRSAPARPRELGQCEWCRGADAVREVEVTPAKRKATATGRPLQPHECAVVVPACATCAAKLEHELEERERERERLAEQKKAARA